MIEFQDRILYARDNFDAQHQELINCLSLAPEVQEKIYHANAEKLTKDI